MPRTKQSQGFASAMKKAGDAWETSRDVKDSGNSYEQQPIDDGTYVAGLTSARTGVDKNKNGYASFNFRVLRGEFEGVSVSVFHSMAETEWRSIEQSLKSLFVDLQSLSGEDDFSEIEPEDIEEMVTELNEECPTIQIGIKNWKSEKGSSGINVYINKRLDDVATATEEIVPEEGDVFLWKSPKSKSEAQYAIRVVDEEEETVTLTRLKDAKDFKNVPWEALGALVDDTDVEDDIPF